MENNKPLFLLQQKPISKTNIYSGNLELIDSRSVILSDNDEPLEIEEVFNDLFKIVIRIVSITAPDDNQKLEINVNNNVIEYSCYNFDNVLGTGINKSIEIANIGEKKIFFQFWIFALGGSNGITRKIEYSLWKER